MIEAVISNWQSLLFYFFIFSVSAGLIYFGHKCSLSSRRHGVILIILGLAIPILAAGVRYGVGKDYFNYAGMVTHLQAGESMWPRPIEPLSSLIINTSALSGGSIMMFSLFSFTTVVCAYLAIKKLSPVSPKYIAFSYFMYLCILFPATLNTVRSGLSISLALLAFSFLVDVKDNYRFTKFIFGLTMAILSHVSALIMLPVGVIVYFLSRQSRVNKRGELICLVASIAGALAFPLLGGVVAHIPLPAINVYGRFFTDIGHSFFTPLVVLVMLLVLIVAVIVTRQHAEKDAKLQIIRAIALYYIPLAIVISWLSYYDGLSRLAFFLDPIVIVLVVYGIQCIEGVKAYGRQIKIVTASIVLVFSLTMMVRNLNWAHALPYSTIFSQEHTREAKD